VQDGAWFPGHTEILRRTTSLHRLVRCSGMRLAPPVFRLARFSGMPGSAVLGRGETRWRRRFGPRTSRCR
jgi:hypothetical protein